MSSSIKKLLHPPTFDPSFMSMQTKWHDEEAHVASKHDNWEFEKNY